ncbi:hypothetical protein [Paraherbaspirillum soli]|uniref:Uncharacterized protein n=1 Tax=Paraherbaspirillum soli TaxID=631222 RepID=A0ABW0MEF5_9BURK
MDDRLKKGYEISPELSAAWNAYMKAGEFKGDDFRSLMNEHMRLFYSYRHAFLNGFNYLRFYAEGCNAQEKEDLGSYNEALKSDLLLLRTRKLLLRSDGRMGRHYDLVRPLERQQIANANDWQQRLYYADIAPSPEELWALEQFKEPPDPQNAPYMALLADQVHDSLAGFYLAGYSSAEEKAEALLAMAREHDKTRKEPSSRYDKRVWDNYQEALKNDPKLAAMMQSRIDKYKEAENAPGYRLEKINALENAHQQTPFSQQEQDKLTPLFPTQTDADAADLGHWAVRTQTDKWREGGGYLRQRVVF